MIKDVTFLTLFITLTSSMMASSKSVNIDTAIACNPEIIAFLPERVRHLCENLEMNPAGLAMARNLYFNSEKRAEGNTLDGPEHLFLRFGR